MTRVAAQQVLVRLALSDESAVGAARRAARALSVDEGLTSAATEALATAVSEIARNAVVYAEGGEALLGVVRDGERAGVIVIIRDRGPGIAAVDDAMRDGFTTGRGLGFGLPGARRLVDQFDIESHVPSGTTVTLVQWADSER